MTGFRGIVTAFRIHPGQYLMIMPELKTISALLLAVCLTLVPSAAGDTVAAEPAEAPVPDETGPLLLTVPETVERVKARNLQLLLQNEQVRRALEQTYQRRAALLPQFGARAQQTRTQIASDRGALVTGLPPFNSFSARIEGSLPLIDAQKFADYRIAKLALAIERFDYEVAVQDVLDQVMFTYFTHLRDLRTVEILEGNLARALQLLDLAEQQFDAGVAVKIDVTRAEVRVAGAKRALMEARTDADESILQLKTLLDLDLARPVSLDRSIGVEIDSPRALRLFGEQLDLMEVRPEFTSRQRQLDQAVLAKRAVNWQRLPEIDLFADWGYDSAEALDGDEGEAWLIGIRATVPIWEGGRIAAERREAKAAIRQNRFAVEQVRNEIQREFEFAGLEMDSRYEQIEFARDEVRLGQDEVDQAQQRYREGLADNRELIDAQQSLADAEESLVRAVYLYGLSRLSFARSIGAVERVVN